MPLYEITAGKAPNVLGPRLVKAKTLGQARAYVMRDWVKVEQCDAERAHVLAARHVKIEDATGITVEEGASSDTAT